MSNDSGIIIERNAQGEVTSVTIHAAEHRELVDNLLIRLGIESVPPISKNEEETWLSIEQARELSMRHIDELWRARK